MFWLKYENKYILLQFLWIMLSKNQRKIFCLHLSCIDYWSKWKNWKISTLRLLQHKAKSSISKFEDIHRCLVEEHSIDMSDEQKSVLTSKARVLVCIERQYLWAQQNPCVGISKSVGAFTKLPFQIWGRKYILNGCLDCPLQLLAFTTIELLVLIKRDYK